MPKLMEDNAINFGASPPGPQNIWGSRVESSSDSSSPRRFGPADDASDSPGSELLQPAHRNLPKSMSPFDDVFDDTGLEEVTDLNDDNDMNPHHPSNHLFDGGNVQSQSAPQPELLLSPPPSAPRATASSSSVIDSHAQHASSSAISSSPSANGAPGAFKMGPVSSSPSKTQTSSSHAQSSASAPSLVSNNAAPPPQRDIRTERLIWLFTGLKAHCESAEFKRQVNLLGKTADFVESQARSVWSLFNFTKPSSGSPAPEDAGSDEDGGIAHDLADSSIDPSQRNASPGPNNTSNTTLFVPPSDTDTTLTLLVVRKNWYGREQYRFLRFESESFVRLRTEPPNYAECERVPYTAIVSARVSSSTIQFNLLQNGTRSEIAYDFGDPHLARSLAEALKFLKGKGTVAVSFVGN